MSKIVDFGVIPSTTIDLKHLSIYLNRLGLCIKLEGDKVTVQSDDGRIIANNSDSSILVSFQLVTSNLALEILININNRANQYYVDSQQNVKKFYTLAHRQILDDILVMEVQRLKNE